MIVRFMISAGRCSRRLQLWAGLVGLHASLSMALASTHSEPKPWHLGALAPTPSAPAAIRSVHIAPGPHAVVVAVIDSGVMPDHPSLAGQLLPGYDMQSPPGNVRGTRSTNFLPDERDTQCGDRLVSGAYRTHGTEVTSLIVGNGHGGVWGVNPSARAVPIRLMGACGMTRRDLIDAMTWAAGWPVAGLPRNPNPARIINLSLAGGNLHCGTELQGVVDRLLARGVFVVAAAGNNFQKPLPEPANCKGVLSVGSVDADNRIEVYSALDPRTMLYAPGGGRDLRNGQPWSENKLRVASLDLDFLGREKFTMIDRGVGTSYAAPVVSGFVSLWLSHHPNKTPQQFFDELPRFLQTVEPSPKCPSCAPKGLVNRDERRFKP
jgi:serine protease